MSYLLGVLLLALLAVGYGLLHRGKQARDCHGCEAAEERAECGSCPLEQIEERGALRIPGNDVVTRRDQGPGPIHLRLE